MGPQSSGLPTKAWLLWQLLFFIASEVIGALSTFSGFDATLDHMAIALNIATTDTIDGILLMAG